MSFFRSYVSRPNVISKSSFETNLTTLDNGIRVVSNNALGHYSAFNVYIDAGSRYETPEFFGVSHALSSVAFKSTENFTAEQIETQVKELGGKIFVDGQHEVINYQAEFNHQNIEKVVSLLAEIIQRPLFLQRELEEQKPLTLLEIENYLFDTDTYFLEKLRVAAYGNISLGKASVCSLEGLEVIHSGLLKEYVRQVYFPERIVIAASGAPHEKIVELTERYFGNMKSYSSSLTSTFSDSKSKIIFNEPPFQPDLSSPVYSGGIYLEECPADLSQLLVGLEGISAVDDIFVLSTLSTLLGGGFSFNTGGLGVGRQSRLFLTVIDKYSWCNSCQAFTHPYRDSGLFGIAGSCHPDFILDMVHVIGISLGSIREPGNIPEIELVRAKNQLKNSLLYDLESKSLSLDQMGMFALDTGQIFSLSTICQRIDQITASDISQLASKLINTNTIPSVLGYGKNIEVLEQAHQILAKYDIGS